MVYVNPKIRSPMNNKEIGPMGAPKELRAVIISTVIDYVQLRIVSIYKKGRDFQKVPAKKLPPVSV